MVKQIDELIYFLLDRISLRSEGINYLEFERLVEEFYSKPDAENSAPPQRNANLDEIFSRLTEHPDVIVEWVDAESGTDESQPTKNPSVDISPQNHSRIILRTTGERVWQAISRQDEDDTQASERPRRRKRSVAKYETDNNVPRKRRKIVDDGASSKVRSPSPEIRHLQNPTNGQPGEGARRASKLISDFETQMQDRAAALVANATAADPTTRDAGKTKTKSVIQSRAGDANGDAASSLEKEQLFQDTYNSLVRMSLPGLYINPPQRLPKMRGRPRHRLLVLIKSEALKGIDWFKNSPPSDRYHHDPSTRYSLHAPLDMSTLVEREPLMEPSIQLESPTQLEPSNHVTDAPEQDAKSPPNATRTSRGKYSDLLKQIVKQAGGAYPGPRDLWYPLITLLNKSGTTPQPNFATVQRAVSSLVNSGKLKNLQFAFTDATGSSIKKSIICLPELDANTEPVKRLEKNMIEHHPTSYFPDNVEIEPQLKPANHDRSSTGGEKVVNANQPFLEPSLPRKSSQPVPNHLDEAQQWKFVQVQETFAAAEQEIAREQQMAIQDRLNASLESRSSTLDPNSWITSSSKLKGSSLKSWQSLAVTFSDPDQRFEPISGTFSTEYAVIRDLRPKLQIQPNLQRDFEDRLPTSLEDIIKSHRTNHSKRSKQTKQDDEFNLMIDEVKKWEENHSQLLSSANSLMTPRFINHTADITTQPPVPDVEPVEKANQLSRKRSHPTADSRPAKRQRGPRKNQSGAEPRTLEEAEMKQPEAGKGVQSSNSGAQVSPVLDKNLQTPLPSKPGRSKTSTKTPSRRAVSFALPESPTATSGGQYSSADTQQRHVSALPSSKPSATRQSIKKANASQGVLETTPLNDAYNTALSPASRFPVSATRKRPGRKPAWASKMSESQIKRFVATIVVVRCLLGGTDRVIKWPLVSKLYTDYDRSGLKYRWNHVLPEKARYIEAYEKTFQESFITAYETGLIGAPNYDDIEAYDWDAVITWAMDHIDVPGDKVLHGETIAATKGPESPSLLLFENREEFDQQYQVQESSGAVDRSTCEFLSTAITISKRVRLIGEMEFSVTTPKSLAPRSDEIVDSNEIVKSYVLANVLAPIDNYDPESARARLVPFGEVSLEAAIKELQKAKVIKQENKGRAAPGRNFSMTKNFFDGFRTNWKPDVLASAVRCKQDLDIKFAVGEQVEFSPHASQGEVMAIMNLQAMGHLDIVVIAPAITTDPAKKTFDQATGERAMSIWGFTEGDYKTVYVDPKNFTFPLRLLPTASWMPGIPLPDPLPAAPAPRSQPGSAAQRIPLWYDIHGRFLVHIWELVVAAVVTTIARAPAASAKEVVSMCKHTIDEWDVRLVLEWMEDLGVAKRTHEIGDRFLAAEWWWCVLGNAVTDES